MITTTKAMKYGGADRPWAFTAEKPISERIVGRKTGSEEKETLQEKYIRAVK